MKNKGLYIAIVVIIAGAAAFLFWEPQTQTSIESANKAYSESQPQLSDSSSKTTGEDSVSESPATASAIPKDKVEQTQQGQFSDEDDIQSLDIMVHEINYSGSAFTPSKLTIKNGDIVIFKNNSDKNFWPASGPHPQHTNYPEFDSKKAIAAGDKFEFKFTKTGIWSFHDHLTPSVTGSITVE